jgi:hypothetical protein
MAHEKHEPKDSSNQTSHVGEQLIYFVEGSLVGCLGVGFKKIKTRIIVICYLKRDNLK